MMPRRTWNLDIDQYLDRFVPPPPWKYMPTIVSRFFGYRVDEVEDVGSVMAMFWAVIGVFCSISIIGLVSLHIPSFEAHDVPVITASFGAGAVLHFYSIGSPLSQPRNAILGQTLSSIVGVGIAKLFLLSNNFQSVIWAAAATSCAVATLLMAATNTSHPPGGATAILAVADDRVRALGWFLVPVVFLSAVLMMAVALLVDNVERRYPLYWWTPRERSSNQRMHSKQGETDADEHGKDEVARTEEVA